jgi:hypothetical protein
MLQPEGDKNKTVANVVILNMPLNVKMTNIISHILTPINQSPLKIYLSPFSKLVNLRKKSF